MHYCTPVANYGKKLFLLFSEEQNEQIKFLNTNMGDYSSQFKPLSIRHEILVIQYLYNVYYPCDTLNDTFFPFKQLNQRKDVLKGMTPNQMFDN